MLKLYIAFGLDFYSYVAVQDCLELLNNLLRSNASNQVCLFYCVYLVLNLVLISTLYGSGATKRDCRT